MGDSGIMPLRLYVREGIEGACLRERDSVSVSVLDLPSRIGHLGQGA